MRFMILVAAVLVAFAAPALAGPVECDGDIDHIVTHDRSQDTACYVLCDKLTANGPCSATKLPSLNYHEIVVKVSSKWGCTAGLISVQSFDDDSPVPTQVGSLSLATGGTHALFIDGGAAQPFLLLTADVTALAGCTGDGLTVRVHTKGKGSL